MFGLIRECLNEYIDFMATKAESRESVDIKRMHENLTLDVITCCAFATKTNSIKDPNNPLLQSCRRFFEWKAKDTFPAFVFPKWLNKALNIESMWDREGNEYVIRISRYIIEQRRQSGIKGNDFIQLLIDAKAGELTEEELDNENSNLFLSEGKDYSITTITMIYDIFR